MSERADAHKIFDADFKSAMSDEKAATPKASLEAHIISVHSAKNEAEWWAHHEILRLRAEIEKLRKEKDHANYCCEDLRITFHNEVEKLRAALKPFADIAKQFEFADDSEGISGVLLGDLRAAVAALKETGDE